MTPVIKESDINILLSPQQETQNLLKTSITKEVANDLTKILNKLIEEHGISADNLIFIVANLMSTVGKYNTLSGLEKKELVIIFINLAIDKSKMDDVEKSMLKNMMQTVVPGAIDMIILVSKGAYKFKYMPVISAWFKRCCACCKC